ncbi:MAG TPA: dihydropyrimidinase [Nitrospiraceae bacterium]|jgi:dihydropyrimidinase|nr:dihydropyrimidinase [Nitrospiraceae bacterium]
MATSVDSGRDVVISGGLLVTAESTVPADLMIRDGKVHAISAQIHRAANQSVIDATGMLVLPGIVDAHVHPIYVDNPFDASVSAAFGGVTTLIHFAYAKPGQKVLETLKQLRDEALAGSILDFGLHAALFDVERQIQEVPSIVQSGTSSFKVFLTYAKLNWMTNDYWLTALMDIVSEQKGLVMVHAENGLATDFLEDKYLRLGLSGVETFAAMRPDVLEAEAVNRAIAIAHVTGCAVYIVHVSAAECLEPLRRALARGWNVYAETCPQYLVLDEDVTKRRGAPAKIGPPLRTAEDCKALWKALAEGVLMTVGSDHAPKLKAANDDFFKAAFGAPQIETMLPVVYHWGINGGKITVNRLVDVMCETPAKIFGLYPRKGTLRIGSDADLVVFDPNHTHKVSVSTQHSRAMYTLYEGMELLGAPVLVMQRGEVIVRDGELGTAPGRAQYLPIKTAHLYDR